MQKYTWENVGILKIRVKFVILLDAGNINLINFY